MWDRLARLFKHRWADDSARVFPPEALDRLTRVVRESEAQHRGEIRICIESGLPNGLLLQDVPIAQLTRLRAVEQFGLLQVWDTEQNNGVLIYLLMAEHAIELVADRGLNQRVTPEVWRTVVQHLSASLQRGHFEDGMTEAVHEVSALLTKHFPQTTDAVNPNELPDQPMLL